MDLNSQQNFNSRNNKVKIIDKSQLRIGKKLHCEKTQLCEQPDLLWIMRSNTLRVGLNALGNRLACINGKINLQWLNLSYYTFKIRCKEIFITNSINWQWYAAAYSDNY